MKKEWVCLVCGTKNQNRKNCQICGFDETLDLQKHDSIIAVDCDYLFQMRQFQSAKQLIKKKQDEQARKLEEEKKKKEEEARKREEERIQREAAALKKLQEEKDKKEKEEREKRLEEWVQKELDELKKLREEQYRKLREEQYKKKRKKRNWQIVLGIGSVGIVGIVGKIGNTVFSEVREYNQRIEEEEEKRICYPDGSTYYGDWILANGKQIRHGYGTYVGTDGSLYCGKWQNDQKSGSGILVENDVIYSCNWNADQKQGEGSIYQIGNFDYRMDTYWKDDQKIGPEEVYTSTNYLYRIYEDNVPNDFSVDHTMYQETMKDTSQNQYELCTHEYLHLNNAYAGRYLICKEIDFTKDNLVWIGGMIRKATIENIVYTGMFDVEFVLNNIVLSEENFEKTVEEGRIFWDYKDTEELPAVTQTIGVGGWTSADGQESYHGSISNWKAYGYGQYEWETGAVYQGMWEEGSPEGYGVWTFENGDTYSGFWSDGKMNGYGVYIGTEYSYEGMWEDGKKQGVGIVFSTDNTIPRQECVMYEDEPCQKKDFATEIINVIKDIWYKIKTFL